jgi:hypothetical protein
MSPPDLAGLFHVARTVEEIYDYLDRRPPGQ